MNWKGIAGLLFVVFLVFSAACTSKPATNRTDITFTDTPTLPDEYSARAVVTQTVMATPAIAVNETPPIIEAYAQTTINGTGLSGGNSSATDSITVNGTTVTVPVAQFYSDVTLGFAPLVVQFTDSSQNLPDSWSWDFGDGGSSTLQNPAYTYNAGGQFSAVLMATNAAGSSNFTSNISVYAPGFSVFPTSGITSTTFTFTDTGTGYPQPTTWLWNFGDIGAGNSSSYQNATHKYVLPGIYNVTLRITSPAGTAWANRSAALTVS